ncbi:hypothetical protein DEG02_017955 [Xanthomonas vasicola]|nr:hypothetical protein NX80_004475 [Xanthomonas vasicola pv. arecae]AZR31835.1 hypothetical protein KWO_016220 [Xanthomonas vasicola pv. musacearum NCPPB 4379]KFA08039.1 hypothetical protein KWM_0113800 [Xanthomonas vasicola pv. musacearum NCPPB 2005]KFA14965.1 hypothetical protein KWQ_0103040 [Xanthomonas vasicola pv. musacearum NCPPB 4380]KFA16860.1 hypothetical protein A11G_0116595 [Xanthomonas vasicola pv. musacearum NCPPB 4392]KFA23646.1 hypothetical protein KWU_0106810 [Xanthomonas vasi
MGQAHTLSDMRTLARNRLIYLWHRVQVPAMIRPLTPKARSAPFASSTHWRQAVAMPTNTVLLDVMSRSLSCLVHGTLY